MTERSESERAEEDRIDRLRLAAFKSNDASDRQSYFDAASKWFQDRHYRRLAAQDQKPTYQVMATDGDEDECLSKDLWMDVPKDVFDDTRNRGDMRSRVVYLSPPPAAGWDKGHGNE